MSIEEWLNLHEGDIVEYNNDFYVVKSVGFEDIDPDEYVDSDYIIEVSHIDDKIYKGGTILRYYQCTVRPEIKNIVNLISNRMPDVENKSDFIK